MKDDGPISLRNLLLLSGADGYLRDSSVCVSYRDLLRASVLPGRRNKLRERIVAVMTSDQLSTALALIELDGIARRLIVCPTIVAKQQLAFVLETAGVEAIISDQAPELSEFVGIPVLAPGFDGGGPDHEDLSGPSRTEWITFTSGTVGTPKLVVHTLASLTGAIDLQKQAAPDIVWGTLYDIRRFGGLQVLLRAVASGRPLILSSPSESIGDYLARACSCRITHISGTPSQWRRVLMSGAAHLITPEYLRLSGEIADQAILDRLRTVYPQATIVHAYGSSEAGTVFEVTDCKAGFPAGMIERPGQVEMKIDGQTLRVRSLRTARSYLGDGAPSLQQDDGFVDTGDTVELREGRYYFTGRRDGRINIGGLKVYPEEVEAVINRHPEVHMCVVQAKKNPVLGAILVANVVLNSPVQPDESEAEALELRIVTFCRKHLPSYKIPAAVRFLPFLPLASSGKAARAEL